jgi:methionine-rich copper-binding protein CopC
MKLIAKMLLSLVLLTACTTLAQAHAFLDHADPKVGSTVSGSPGVVKIWFTEELEGAFSKIRVLDPAGKEIDKKDSQVDSSDKAVMTVSLPKLAPGTYKVTWSAVALDTHHTTGTFSFTVAGE